MEQVFEDFVTHSFLRHQNEFRLTRQGPERYLAKHNGKGAFKTKPDISLTDGSGRVALILDAKWKEIDASKPDKNYGIAQSDLYQLYAYGKRYKCQILALVYPQTRNFNAPLTYRLVDELTLLCLPFDVTAPNNSVQLSMQTIGGEHLKATQSGYILRPSVGKKSTPPRRGYCRLPSAKNLL